MMEWICELKRRMLKISIVLGILLSALSSSRAVATTTRHATRANQMRELNNEVLGIHGLIQEAGLNDAEALRSQTTKVLSKRAAALSALIQEDPNQALSFAFSPDLLNDIATKFPESASLLEAHGVWQGTIQSWAMDYDDGSHRTVHLMHSGRETIEIHFAAGEPVGLQSGVVLSVTGVRVGSQVVGKNASVESATALAASTTDTSTMFPVTTRDATATASTVCCSTTGVQNIAVFLITFPGVTPPSYLTAQNVYASYFGTGRSLDSYWREASYGQTSAKGDVLGWYTLSTSYGCTTNTDFNAMVTETFNQASGAGVNLQNYTSFSFVAPQYECGWSGLASIGAVTTNSITAYWSYINGTNWSNDTVTAALTIMHEAGHNLGLNHSNSRAFGSEVLGSLGSAGTVTEYGDGFSAMSNGGSGHYTAPHKVEILHWLPNYQVVQSGGTYTIQPLELVTGGVQALKIQRGTGNNAWLWIEYRQPIGNYDIDYYRPNDPWDPWANQVFSGAVIHYEDSLTTSAHSDLLDFTPTSAYGFYDPALAAGQTWSDPYSNLSISVQSATASGLTVSVAYSGTVSCTHANPSASMSPTNPTVSAGSSVNYTVSVKNNDAPSCPASMFSLVSTQPSGWVGSSSVASLTISPGQSASATLTETVATTAAPGTYAISSSAINGAYTGSATANTTVVSLTSTLTDSTSVSASIYSAPQKVAVTAIVTSGGAPAVGAKVTFTVTKAGGTKVNGNATTDATGKATWSYRISQKDPIGVYSVMNSATYSSQSVTSNGVSFAVQ